MFLGEINTWICQLSKVCMYVHILQYMHTLQRAWEELKGRGKRTISPSPFFFSSCLYAWVGISVFFRPTSLLLLGPLDWNHITAFPGCPVCRKQIVGLGSLHNHVCQFLIINLTYICISSCFISSRESWLIQHAMIYILPLHWLTAKYLSQSPGLQKLSLLIQSSNCLALFWSFPLGEK